MNPDHVYDAVDAFLKQEGYSAAKRRKDEVDGHMIRHYISAMKMSPCSSNPQGSCVAANFENLFEHLKQVPGWTEAHKVEVLRAGGYLG